MNLHGYLKKQGFLLQISKRKFKNLFIRPIGETIEKKLFLNHRASDKRKGKRNLRCLKRKKET